MAAERQADRVLVHAARASRENKRKTTSTPVSSTPPRLAQTQTLPATAPFLSCRRRHRSTCRDLLRSRNQSSWCRPVAGSGPHDRAAIGVRHVHWVQQCSKMGRETHRRMAGGLGDLACLHSNAGAGLLVQGLSATHPPANALNLPKQPEAIAAREQAVSSCAWYRSNGAACHKQKNFGC